MSRLKDLRKYVDAELDRMQDSEKRISAAAHLYGVSLAAAMLAKRRGLDPELASMAGMLHDLHAYRTGSYDDHAHKGAELARQIRQHPDIIGRQVGFHDLTPLHGEWIREMVFGQGDYTLQAHRGSYKSSCLAVAISLILIIYPTRNIIFIRKADNDVAEMSSLSLPALFQPCGGRNTAAWPAWLSSVYCRRTLRCFPDLCSL